MMAQPIEKSDRVQVTSNPSTSQSQIRYKIKMLERCERDYKKLIKKNTIIQRLVEIYLEELQTHPYIGEKLYENFPGCRSIHFRGNSYRIIYKVIDEPEPEILILEIGHRSSSYAELARILGQGK